jgi:CRISPR-associated protein (TIGR02584 family)
MSEEGQRHILLCVAGLTPQIVTETLYVLTQQRGQAIDEIRVITTLDGRDKIMTGVVNGRGRPEESLLHPEVGQFYAFCRDFNIDPRSIKFDEKSIALLRTRDGLTLPDIRTPEENELAGDQICDILRELTKDPTTRIHASAAGGRKTMSIYLTAAMQLFGRTHDSLSHVLVSEEFETHREFFYKPPVPRMLEVKDRAGNTRLASTDEAQIHLAPIPFIRLRGARSEWLREATLSYGQFVREAQDYLDLADSTHDLRIDPRRSTVTVAGRSFRLTKREHFIYVLFAIARKKGDGNDGFLAVEEITRERLAGVFSYLTSARGQGRELDDYQLVAGFGFLGSLTRSVNQADCEDIRNTCLQTSARIKGKLDAAGVPERYAITRLGERGAARYGLLVPPERIILL